MREELRKSAEVIDLAALKEKRLMQKSLDDYRVYLKGLGMSQVEGEAHYLLEEFSGQNFGPDFLHKVQMLLGEIGNRADGNFKTSILRIKDHLPTQLT